MPTIHLFPNPYARLDHNGMLCGACPIAEEPRRGGALPARQSVGATLKVLSVDRSEAMGRGPGGPNRSKSQFVWEFGSEVVELNASPSLMGYYVSRDRCGDVFLGQKVPMQRLKAARAKAIAEFRDAYGTDPPTSEWVKQFALDSEVAADAAPPAAEKAEKKG